MGAMFIGQQFLQNVLDYSTLDSGLAILPAAAMMVVVAPRSAKLVESRGARFTLLIGYVFCLLGFLTMLLLWKEGISYWKVGLGYALIGIGVGFAGTPASHSLTGSVPVRRAGMASGHGGPPARPRRRDHAVDLRRPADRRLRGGGRGAAIASSPESAKVTENVEGELTKSFSSAADLASQYPRHTEQIIAAAKTSFLQGDELGLHGRHRRRPARRGARLLPLPEEGRGGEAARAVPRRRWLTAARLGSRRPCAKASG